MLIVCQWSDVLTDVDYTQDSPFWCGLPSSKMNVSDKILNPNIAHDMKIWEQHVQKENDIGDIVPWVYTDEEERERERQLSTIWRIVLLLWNSLRWCRRPQKRRGKRVFRFIIPALKVGCHIDSSTFLWVAFIFLFFPFSICFDLFFLLFFISLIWGLLPIFCATFILSLEKVFVYLPIFCYCLYIYIWGMIRWHQM